MFKIISKVLLVASAVAQVKYKFEEEEFLLNRAVSDA